MMSDIMRTLAERERRQQQIDRAPGLMSEMEKLAALRPDMMHVESDDGPKLHGGWGLVFSLLAGVAMWAAGAVVLWALWSATP